jgi:hypothetical protein
VLLLVGVSRHEAPAGAECHVEEAGAIDSGRGHPAPLVRRAEERARLLDRVGCDGTQPVGIRLAAELFAPRPARIGVGGFDAHPRTPVLEDAQGLAGKSLRHLLGVLRRLGAKGRELAYERMFA